MKKQFKSAALLAVLALAATGCQKENDVLPLAGAEQQEAPHPVTVKVLDLLHIEINKNLISVK